MSIDAQALLQLLGGAVQSTDEPEPDDAKGGLDLSKLVALIPLIVQLLPVIRQLIDALKPKREPKPDLEPVPPVDNDENGNERIEPLPDFTDPDGGKVVPVRGVLELRWFVHERSNSLYYPTHAVINGQRVEDNGEGFWSRATRRRRVNTHTRIGVTPTFYDAHDNELAGPAWDANGWTNNLVYAAAVGHDPSNSQSPPEGERRVSKFFGDGTAGTTITISPRDANANVGGKSYRAGQGRAAEVNCFEEGEWELWAETPDGFPTAKVKLSIA